MKARYAVLALCLCALPARADCAAGPSYNTQVTGNTVLICNTYSFFTCDAGTLLREDVDSGAVVQLSSFCVEGDAGPTPGLCYEDECVPPGSYRYGFEEPYACGHFCNGTPPLWGEATVTAPLDGGCGWSNGDSAPGAYGGSLPWSGKGSQFEQCGGCGCSTSGAVFGFDGAILALSLALLWRRRARR